MLEDTKSEQQSFVIHEEDYDQFLNLNRIYLETNVTLDENGVAVQTPHVAQCYSNIDTIVAAREAKLTSVEFTVEEVRFLSKLYGGGVSWK